VDGNVRIALVPNSVDLDAFPPGEPVPDDGPLHLLCVARLIERKGQRHLIEAVKRLVDEGIDVTLELVGTGDAGPAYEALVRSLGLEDRVRFAGYVPREEIARHYAAAHVFVLPSYNEGMSVATLEAMAAGLPVVTTRTGGTKELVDEGTNGLVYEWGDVDALARHLGQLAGNREAVCRMGAASRTRAKLFSWQAGAEQYVAMFTHLAPASE